MHKKVRVIKEQEIKTLLFLAGFTPAYCKGHQWYFVKDNMTVYKNLSDFTYIYVAHKHLHFPRRTNNIKKLKEFIEEMLDDREGI